MMTVRRYKLTKENERRLIEGLKVAISIPLIDSIEDFVWESIFSYMKNISSVDPFKNIRKKLLYDVADTSSHVGWSVKALQWSLKPDSEFEIVIQRADIIKNADQLGFPGLSLNSDPDEIGKAILRHWQNKIVEDAVIQKISDKRICILLKNKNCTKFSYIEEDIALYDTDEIRWEWTNGKKVGLKGIRKIDNFCVYKWYPSGKQLFERFKFGSSPKIYNIPLRRFDIHDLISLVNPKLK